MENQCQISWDRISALPEDITVKILTHMPIRDALRTSILSKKWRFCWTRMPRLVFDAYMVKRSQNLNKIIFDNYKAVNAIIHVLFQHRAPILGFSLSVNPGIFSEIDPIILYLSRSNNIKKFIFDRIVYDHKRYVLPCSIFNLQGLEHLDLTNCKLELPSMNMGFSMLKSLRFFHVWITNKMLQRFLANCPLLEEFTLLDFDDDDDDGIVFTESEFVELVKCLPSVQVLTFSEFYIEHTNAGGMPRELSTSPVNLRILDVGVRYNKLSSVLRVISSSPNLEKIKLDIWGECPERDSLRTSNNLLDMQAYMGLNLDHLKELEITCFLNHAFDMEFVKIIMANSPVLKKVRIELDLGGSVDEEVKLLQDLLLLPRASPAAKFIIQP